MRIRTILRTELNVKVVAINTLLAIPVMTYSFGIINWVLAEIKQKNMDTIVRKLITCHRMLHPRANIISISREKMVRSTSIDLQNNHDRVKEILRHFNRLDSTINKNTREVKKISNQ